MDFGGLKKLLSFIPDQYDHSFMVYELDPFADYLEKFSKALYEKEGGAVLRVRYMPFIPTAEKIAEFVFENVKMRGAPVVEVTVWETPSCKATVTK